MVDVGGFERRDLFVFDIVFTLLSRGPCLLVALFYLCN